MDGHNNQLGSGNCSESLSRPAKQRIKATLIPERLRSKAQFRPAGQRQRQYQQGSSVRCSQGPKGWRGVFEVGRAVQQDVVGIGDKTLENSK